VHGAIGPDRVFAVGNTIKLATDSLHESDDLEGHAEDVRQLGELVRTLLAPNPIGEPLRTVVQHAIEPDLRNRWTLAEIANAMHRAVPEARSIPAPARVEVLPPPSAPASPVTAPAAAAVVAPPAPAPQPPMFQPLPPPVHRHAEPAVPIGFPKWIFVGAAAV